MYNDGILDIFFLSQDPNPNVLLDLTASNVNIKIYNS